MTVVCMSRKNCCACIWLVLWSWNWLHSSLHCFANYILSMECILATRESSEICFLHCLRLQKFICLRWEICVISAHLFSLLMLRAEFYLNNLINIILIFRTLAWSIWIWDVFHMRVTLSKVLISFQMRSWPRSKRQDSRWQCRRRCS